jgi:glycosyltransferase involved in cell wall biosynthesis
MKIALVHDWLNTKIGGAERVLFTLAEIFPTAPIYTLIYNHAKFGKHIEQGRVNSSFLQNLPDTIKNRPRYLLPLIPTAVERFDFKEFDVVISGSSGYVKNIITPPHVKHICYCHSPLRLAWDYWPQYLNEQNIGKLRRLAAERMIHTIRLWDSIGSTRVDKWVANSQTSASRIAKYYKKKSTIIYPPVPVKKLYNYQTEKKSDYYMTLAMLTPYKKIDQVIEAFNANGKRLLVPGEGPDKERLQKLAKPNIEFTGYLEEEEKFRTLAQAKALIFPNEEDFGIAPIEAMAVGTPIIAFGRGGLKETVIHGKTGLFYNLQTAAELNRTIENFESAAFSSSILHRQAAKFDEALFRKSILSLL